MGITLKLTTKSNTDWLNAVLNDFDTFLPDHADCERKASTMAMSFVAKYPDRVEIVSDLIATAVEELVHFQQVYRLMEKRGVALHKEMTQDLYIKQLVWLARSGRVERFMDRMIIAAVVESRGAERFKMIAHALTDKRLKNFYLKLHESEAGHERVYLNMLQHYFSESEIQERVNFFVEKESEILEGLEIRPALH